MCSYRNEVSHDFEEISIDDASHSLVCKDCGYTKEGAHNMSCVSVNSSLHRYTCEDCSYTIIDYHNLICEIINENRHRFNCVDCEYNLVEDHNFALKSVSATHHIDICFYCGLTKGSQGAHSWKVSNDPKYVECSYCGYLKLKPTIGGGEIIPVQPFNKEDELEEETE